MKKLLFILLSVLLYSCSNEMLLDTDMTDVSTTTRVAASDSVYYFGLSDSNDDFVFRPKSDSQPLGKVLSSYVEVNGVITLVKPEIVNKPSWVNYCICSQYYDEYVLLVAVDNNTSSERSGKVVLKQPGSNKTLSIGITQHGFNNYIHIRVNKTYKNQYEFIATTDYPVKEELRIYLPLVVYNDGGELAHEAGIFIKKGESTGTYLMDWNASPLVAYHGDITGYRLYEGRIVGGDDIYTYEFVRYW